MPTVALADVLAIVTLRTDIAAAQAKMLPQLADLATLETKIIEALRAGATLPKNCPPCAVKDSPRRTPAYKDALIKATSQEFVTNLLNATEPTHTYSLVITDCPTVKKFS
jgi:hypothetical protein